MSTFVVTPQPSEIYLGQQGIVTLYNEGPSTIWLDTVPGVSFLNGFELQPRGQMTWNSAEPLWATTRAFGTIQLTAKLRTNDAGGLSVNTRAQYYSLIGTSAQSFASNFFGNTAFGCEVGHVATVRILRKFVRSGAYANGQFEFLQFAWYDDDQTQIFTEQICVNLSKLDLLGNTTDYYLVNLPVKGRYLGILPTSTVDFSSAYVRVYGTDQDEPYWQNSGWSPPATFTSVSASEGVIYVNGWGLNTFYIPSMGDRLSVQFSSTNVTVAGHLQINDTEQGTAIGDLVIPVGAPTFVRAEFEVPVRRAMFCTTSGVTAPGSNFLSIVQNYP